MHLKKGVEEPEGVEGLAGGVRELEMLNNRTGKIYSFEGLDKIVSAGLGLGEI